MSEKTPRDLFFDVWGPNESDQWPTFDRDLDALIARVRREAIEQCAAAIEAFANMAYDSAFARTAAKQLAADDCESSQRAHALAAKLAQVEKELHRWQHGAQIEGDYICEAGVKLERAEAALGWIVKTTHAPDPRNADYIRVRKDNGISFSQAINHAAKLLASTANDPPGGTVKGPEVTTATDCASRPVPPGDAASSPTPPAAEEGQKCGVCGEPYCRADLHDAADAQPASTCEHDWTPGSDGIAFCHSCYERAQPAGAKCEVCKGDIVNLAGYKCNACGGFGRAQAGEGER